MNKRYKVMVDFTNFIPIGEDELQKALMAMAANGKAFFENGATDRIHAVLPDFHAMMGWNQGYKLEAEDWALIGRDKNCTEAKLLLATTKSRLAGIPERPKEISEALTKIAREKTEATWDR